MVSPVQGLGWAIERPSPCEEGLTVAVLRYPSGLGEKVALTPGAGSRLQHSCRQLAWVLQEHSFVEPCRVESLIAAGRGLQTV